MALVVAMREIESRDVHASIDEGDQALHRPAGGAEGANDLRLALLGRRHLVDMVEGGGVSGSHDYGEMDGN